MQEILEQLKEVQTTLDTQLHDTFFTAGMGDQRRAIRVFWKAKQNIWWAQMHVLDAFRGHIPDAEL